MLLLELDVLLRHLNRSSPRRTSLDVALNLSLRGEWPPLLAYLRGLYLVWLIDKSIRGECVCLNGGKECPTPAVSMQPGFLEDKSKLHRSMCARSG